MRQPTERLDVSKRYRSWRTWTGSGGTGRNLLINGNTTSEIRDIYGEQQQKEEGIPMKNFKNKNRKIRDKASGEVSEECFSEWAYAKSLTMMSRQLF